ncbi:MAG: hypothetical protein IPP49_16940 [Saprospiraceae bacterium]|nr:hypothetical protein [Saprospiraceae bacterium]
MNSSDFEAGLEYVIEYLPKEDYSSFGTSGSPKNGYNINIGTQLALNPSFDLQFQTGYKLYRYEIRGQVYNLRSNINRPLSESIPTSANKR